VVVLGTVVLRRPFCRGGGGSRSSNCSSHRGLVFKRFAFNRKMIT